MRAPTAATGWSCWGSSRRWPASPALSLAWSIGPDLSLEETARTFAYLAAFAAAVGAARLWPDAAPVVLGAVLTAALAVAGWALITRVWPGALAEDVLNSRISEPLEYWNALGSMAALGTPAALWLATRREGGQAVRRARPTGARGPGARPSCSPSRVARS